MNSRDQHLRRLVDRVDIIDTIVRFANAFDSKDWEALRSCLADEIEADYSQFRGDPPARMDADSYVAARQTGLEGLHTAHITTNHSVTVEGDTATCRSAYQIYRIVPRMQGSENRLDTVGHYEHDLARTDAGWCITSLPDGCGARRQSSNTQWRASKDAVRQIGG